MNTNTSLQLIGFADIFQLTLLMLIPGQCFWTGLAIAKRSLRESTIFQIGNSIAYVGIYGVLNVIGGQFLIQVNHAVLDSIRGLVLVGVGLITLRSVWGKSVNPEKKAAQLEVLPKFNNQIRVLLLGIVLVITNPIVYALLIPYTEPLVKLEYHWSVYAIFMRLVVIFPVYFALYGLASKVGNALRSLYGKFVWSAVATLPIYYGVVTLLKV